MSDGGSSYGYDSSSETYTPRPGETITNRSPDGRTITVHSQEPFCLQKTRDIDLKTGEESNHSSWGF